MATRIVSMSSKKTSSFFHQFTTHLQMIQFEPFLSRNHQKIRIIVMLIIDISFLIILYFLSTFLVGFLQNASFLFPGFPDWNVHAFRVSYIQQYGLTSWSHVWSNGANIWQSYHFVPHIITAFLSDLFSVEVNRMLIKMTVGLVVMLCFNIYIILRLLRVHPTAAITSSLLVLTLGQLWGTVNEFSLLMAFSLFPWYLYAWIFFVKDKILYIFPFLCGLAFYIHFMLGVYMFALLAIGILFNKQRVVSIQSVIQFLLFLIGASLFLSGLIFKDTLGIPNVHLEQQDFYKTLFNNYEYFGLSSLVFGCILVAIFAVPIASQKKGYHWVPALLLFVTVFLSLTLISLSLTLPTIITKTQFIRGISFVGIAAIVLSAIVFDFLIRKSLQVWLWIFVVIGSLAVIQSAWYASVITGVPVDNFDNPVHAFAEKNPDLPLNKYRIWTEEFDVSSYYNGTTYRYPVSYMTHLEPNYVATRLLELTKYSQVSGPLSQSVIDRLTNYFKVTGVNYIILERGSIYSNGFFELGDETYKLIDSLQLQEASYDLFESSWEPIQAAAIPEVLAQSEDMSVFTFDENEILQFSLDDRVYQFANQLYSNNLQLYPVNYRSEQQITINIPQERVSNKIYINENYSPQWHATFNGQTVSFSAVGPGYLLVDLGTAAEGGTLQLTHSWHWSRQIGTYVIGITSILLLIYYVFQIPRIKTTFRRFINSKLKHIKQIKKFSL